MMLIDRSVVLKYGGEMHPLSVMSMVQFPLVRNVKSYPRPGNIGIEQSQVEIYVPKSHHWFDFGGTVHLTQDEAERKAGRIAVFNKLGQRFIEAAKDKNPFTQARGKKNLENWLTEAQTIQDQDGRSGNNALQSQISANAVTLPFVGLIALLAGIVLLVAHYWWRRTAAV